MSSIDSSFSSLLGGESSILAGGMLEGGKRRRRVRHARKVDPRRGTKKVKCSSKSRGKKCVRKVVCRKGKCSSKKFRRIVGTRLQVWRGLALKTSSGLKKSDLMKNKAGKIVSRRKHAKARKSTGARKLALWRKAVRAAAKKLGMKKKFLIAKKGTKLYALARKIYNKSKGAKVAGKRKTVRRVRHARRA